VRRLNELLEESAAVNQALRGHRVLIPSGTPHTEGAGRFGRTYTAIISPEGQLVSLSQCLGRADAPPEVAHLDTFLQAVRPGITFDFHEDFGRDFYLPARRDPRDPAAGEPIVMAMYRAVRDAGHSLADPDAYLARRLAYSPYWPPYHELSGL